MARGQSNRGTGGTSRFRFVMFEGDLQEGELAQVTQAIQNAFRGPQVISARPGVRGAPAVLPNSEVVDVEENDEADVDFSESVPAARPRAARKAQPPKVPNPVNDLDVKSDPPLKEFVA